MGKCEIDTLLHHYNIRNGVGWRRGYETAEDHLSFCTGMGYAPSARYWERYRAELEEIGSYMGWAICIGSSAETPTGSAPAISEPCSPQTQS
jgi:hypothetical protein